MKRQIFDRTLITLCALALVGLATPAFAETVYVPVVLTDLGGATYETQVQITNPSTEDRQITTYFFGAETNGNERPENAGQDILLRAGTTFETLASGSGSGLFEVTTSAADLAVHARIIGKIDGNEFLNAEIPVISERNAFGPGLTAYLQGWMRGGEQATDFGLVNVGSQEALCSIDLHNADGSVIVTDVELTWQPRSHRHFSDALSILDLEGVDGIRVTITCDQTFYPYATVVDRTDGQVMFVAPSTTTIFGLPDPGDDQFDYLSDINWVELYNVRSGPHRDASGFEPHAPGGEIGGYKSMEINGVTYPKGLSWFPGWGDSKVTWSLEGKYKRFEAIVRVDDEKFGKYEWGVVNRATGEFIRIERPPQGFNGPENNTRFRIGAGTHIQIKGDGALLYESPEFYAHGPAIPVSVNISGVQTLSIILIGTHREQADAPYRAGLSSTPALVLKNTFHDLINLADAKLILE